MSPCLQHMRLYGGCGGGRGRGRGLRRGRWCSCAEVRGFPVMDVPVLLSDKFLQSKEFDQNVPQIQFFFRVWGLPVV